MNVLRGLNGPRYRRVAGDAGVYETIAVDKLTPVIGAEVGGVDLTRPLEGRQVAEIGRALARAVSDPSESEGVPEAAEI